MAYINSPLARRRLGLTTCGILALLLLWIALCKGEAPLDGPGDPPDRPSAVDRPPPLVAPTDGQRAVAEESRDPRSDAASGGTRVLKIRGSVRMESGAPVPGLRVVASGPVGRPIWRTASSTDPAGNFTMELEVGERCRDLLLRAEGLRGASPVVSYPCVEPIAEGQTDLAATLVLREGCLIEGRVDTGRVARVLLRQLPRADPRPRSGWNRQGGRYLNSLLRPDEEGRFRAIVRPGLARLRAIGGGGVLGRVVIVDAARGRTTRVGELVVPDERGRVTVRVLDEDDQPIVGAWVHVSDLDLHVVSPRGHSPLPHFLTDPEGAVELPPLGGEHGSLVVAAGSPNHETTESQVPLPATDSVHVFQLKRRPRMVVRVLTASGGRLSQPQLSAVTPILRVAGAAGAPSVGTVSSPAQELNLHFRTVGFGVANPERSELWIDRPSGGGAYTLMLRTPLDEVVSTAIDVPDDPATPATATIRLPEGRFASLAVSYPEQLERRIVRKQLRARLRSAADPAARPLPLSANRLIDDAGDAIPLWVPAGYDTIELFPKNDCLLPIEQALLPLKPAGEVRTRLRLLATAGGLRIRVVDERGMRLSGTWDLRVLPVVSDGPHACRSGIVATLIGRHATPSTVWVRAGTYEVRVTQSFGSPFAFARVHAEPGVIRDAEVSLGGR